MGMEAAGEASSVGVQCALMNMQEVGLALLVLDQYCVVLIACH